MELVFLGKANTRGLNSVKLPAYLPCLPQASIGRIDSGGGQNYLSITSLLSLNLARLRAGLLFLSPTPGPFLFSSTKITPADSKAARMTVAANLAPPDLRR